MIHSPIKQLNDTEFLFQFENQTLDMRHFNHMGHLRLAWLYLSRYDVDTAVKLVCSRIQAYATSLGASRKFHLTITNALVRIMAKRRDNMQKKEWELFLLENQDLVNDAISVLDQHFSKGLLFSEQARTTLVQPDKKPL
jgi:hypothetical protein